MKKYGIRGQVLWFAFGTWAGAAFAEAVEIIARNEFKNRPWFDAELGIFTLIALCVPLACILAIPYAAWLWVRVGRKSERPKIPWVFPLVSGIAYFPLLISLIPLLIHVTGQGQGTIIGTSIGGCVLGLPVVFAEFASRFALRQDGSYGEN